MNITITQDGEMTIPCAELLNAGLNAGEITAIILMMAITEGHQDFTSPLLQDPAVQAALGTLKERGIISAKVEGQKVSILVDLEKL